MQLVDTHAHLYLEEFSDLDPVLERFKSKSGTKVYLPNIDSTTVEDMKRIVAQYPEILIPTMGLHPCYVKSNYRVELDFIEQELMSHKGYYKAVGEIGIDLYWDKSTFDIQKEAYHKQIEWASKLDLPIIIHSRDSLDHTIAGIRKFQSGNLKGIFHCFNGTVEQGKEIIDLGFHLGIGGVATFKNAGVDKVIAQLPLTHMVLETDAPYLAPTPYRGKRNECAYLYDIAIKLSDLHHKSITEIADITTANAKFIFE